MAETIDFADTFVRSVLEDNARLRTELEASQAILRDQVQTAKATERRYLSALYRAARKAGGELDLTESPEKRFEFDGRRLHIERDDYGEGSIGRVRLIADTEVVPAGDKTWQPSEAA